MNEPPSLASEASATDDVGYQLNDQLSKDIKNRTPRKPPTPSAGGGKTQFFNHPKPPREHEKYQAYTSSAGSNRSGIQRGSMLETDSHKRNLNYTEEIKSPLRVPGKFY
jgi:hypothetical protein